MKALTDEYARLQKRSRIHIVEAPGGPRYCVHHYDDVSAAFKSKVFRGGQTPPYLLRLMRWVGLSGLSNAAESGFYAALSPPEHTRIRKVVDPVFSPRRVNARAPAIERIIEEFLDRLDGRKEFDLVSDFAMPLPAWVIADVFGFPTDEMDAVRKWTDDLLPMVDPETRSPKALLRSVVAFSRFRRRVFQLVANRRDDPREDLLSDMAEALYSTNTITRDEMIGAAALTLTAGHVTTRHLLTNCVRLLLENPSALERARQDPDTFDRVIEEAIRMISPIQTTGRETTKDVELGGERIPSGSKIRLFVGAANHDPERFEHPATFDIDRPDNRHLGFGGGIHFCIGIHLARLEVRMALKKLFERFPKLTMSEDGILWGPSRKFPGISRFRVQTNV